ncbi:LytTR family transcriptional regulator DNA-binding domain-containing protein [Clostridioides difficile]
MEKDLNIEELVRCHKSYIINLNYVENIKVKYCNIRQSRRSTY